MISVAVLLGAAFLRWNQKRRNRHVVGDEFAHQHLNNPSTTGYITVSPLPGF